MNLFAYGTLMFREIWERVAGQAAQGFRPQPASVRGMAIYRAAGESFPVMVASGDEWVADGIVYFDLPADIVTKLDDYESNFYDRVEVAATLDDGRLVTAHAYVLPSRHQAAATREPWSAKWFREEAMASYLQQHGLQ